MQVGTAILTGVITIFTTVVAIRLDRWLDRKKVAEERKKHEKEELLKKTDQMLDYIEELLGLLRNGVECCSQRDQFKRKWISLKKLIPDNKEMSQLVADFQNADSALGLGRSGIRDAIKAMERFKNKLTGLMRRMEFQNEPENLKNGIKN
ncbi:MAG: hypothetical protein WC959_09295 [Kiritimatiellales bacterium]